MASSTGSRSTSSIASNRAPSRDLVRALGATYHAGGVADIGFQPDVIIECTGVGQVIADSVNVVAAGGIVCLTGVGTGGRTAGQSTADIAATMVLQNNVIVGSVNANKRHWYKAGQVAGSRGRDVAGAPAVAAREAGGVHERAAPPAGRHQGRHPVRRRVIGTE